MCGWSGCDSEYAICRDHWKRLNDDERWQVRFAFDSPFYGYKGTNAFLAWASSTIDGSEKMRVYDAPEYRTWLTAEGVVRILTVLVSFEVTETVRACCELARKRFLQKQIGRNVKAGRKAKREGNDAEAKARMAEATNAYYAHARIVQSQNAVVAPCADEDDDGEYV